MEANKGMSPRELEPQEVVSEIEEYFEPVLEWLSTSSLSAIEKRFKVQFGSGGPREYYFRLVLLVKEIYSDFTPEGTYEWEQERSDERIEAADRKLKELNVLVQKSIFDRLKEKYGTDPSSYWEKGVDKDDRGKAYTRSLDDDVDTRVLPENYLFFHEYKTIVEKSKHWLLFEDLFDIPIGGVTGRAKNIQWMDRVNDLRRIPAHATEDRVYRLEDLDLIDYIHGEFTRRLETAEIEPEKDETSSEDETRSAPSS